MTSEYFKKWYKENHEREKNKRREYAKSFRENRTLAAIFNGTKHRAKKNCIEFSITLDDLPVPDLCPILKVPFIRGTRHAMSIDRIKPELGYIPGNVWIISKKANVMKNDATVEELKQFGIWIERHLNSC